MAATSALSISASNWFQNRNQSSGILLNFVITSFGSFASSVVVSRFPYEFYPFLTHVPSLLDRIPIVL